jgi:hypothetical protein
MTASAFWIVPLGVLPWTPKGILLRPCFSCKVIFGQDAYAQDIRGGGAPTIRI